MLTIRRVVMSGACDFCGRDKEVVAVLLEGQSNEVLLCWADVKKHTHMQMRLTGKGGGTVPVTSGTTARPSTSVNSSSAK